jgi:hypothetical protein
MATVATCRQLHPHSAIAYCSTTLRTALDGLHGTVFVTFLRYMLMLSVRLTFIAHHWRCARRRKCGRAPACRIGKILKTKSSVVAELLPGSCLC